MDRATAHHYYVLIPAAGVGSRMGEAMPKQYMPLAGKTVIEHTLAVFLADPRFEKIIVTLNPDDAIWPTLSISQHKKIVTVLGGTSRPQSVLNGLLHLEAVANLDDWVLVHDAVRPCVQESDLNKLLAAVKDHSVGGLLATPEPNTLKKCEAATVVTTLPRENIWQALTPQMFRLRKLLPALQAVLNKQQNITDDAMALELLGERPLIVAGRRDNIKITYPDDLQLAEKILRGKSYD